MIYPFPPAPSWPWPQQGWQCPKCQSVYSPTVVECYRCNSQTQQLKTTYSTTGEQKP